MGDRQGRDEVELEAGAGNLAGFELAWPSKVIPRLGLKSEDGVEGQNDETCDLWLLGCPRACDIQNLNRGLRQPIFEPLSDSVIAGRQMNPRLVMLFGELSGFLRSARQFGWERK